MKCLLRRIAPIVNAVGWGLFVIWNFGLVFYCGPFPELGNLLLAILWTAGFFAISFFVRNEKWKRLLILGFVFSAICPYVFFLNPSNDRDWVVSQEQTSSATITGDNLDIHSFRDFDYSADGLPTGQWFSRNYDLKNLKGMDFIMTHWTTDNAGHPIFSFDFGPQGHLAFTVEARMEKGESYSLTAGLYNCFELAYIPCEESDAVRVRTNFRENEHVYLYRTIATPAQARARLFEFLATMNKLAETPRFYNVITSNCTTAVRSQMSGGFPFDWRIILNGRLDEMLYERGLLVTSGLPFPELKRSAYINLKVREHPGKENFSERIRNGVPGF